MLAILDNCTPEQREEFHNFQPGSGVAGMAKMEQPERPLQEAPMNEPDLQPDSLEDFVVVDEVAEDDNDRGEYPACHEVIDSHVHLDRISQKIWVYGYVGTVEELLAYSGAGTSGGWCGCIL